MKNLLLLTLVLLSLQLEAQENTSLMLGNKKASLSMEFDKSNQKDDELILNPSSQTMTIKFKDGTVQDFNMNGIASIIFSNDFRTKTFSAYLSKAGMLSSVLPKSDARDIFALKLSGHLDARDFNYIKWFCTRIQTIDLADVEIDAYTGDNGTNEGYEESYLANEVPAGSFYYWSTSKYHSFSGIPKNEGMSSLTKIILPKGIRSIGRKAFSDMPRLESIAILSPYPPKLHVGCFSKLPKETKVYVPIGAKSRYLSAGGWGVFKEIVEVNANGVPVMIDSPLIGTWKTTRTEGWGESANHTGIEYLQLMADGSYIHVEEENGEPNVTRGTWTFTEKKFTLHKKDGELAGSSFDYEIIELNTNNMKVSMWHVIAYMEKVQDSVIKQYIKK